MTDPVQPRPSPTDLQHGSGRSRPAPAFVHGELVVRSVPRLGPWRDEWDALVLEAPLPSPFLRSWWLAHTAQAQPRFVLVLDGERLVGGMALEEDRVLGLPRFRVLGHGRLVPDHLDALVAEDRSEEVMAALAAWCRRRGQRLFDLNGVVAGSNFLQLLPGPVMAERIEQCRYRRLPEDPDLVVQEMSGSERSAVKRGRKKVVKAGAEHRQVPPEETDASLARLRELHGRRWGAESGFLELFEPFAAAAREGVTRGEVRLHELAVGEQVVAVNVEFHLAGRAFTFQDGRDPDTSLPSVGSVLQAYAVEDACRDGAREYDFLRGSQPYKIGWTDHARPVMRLRAARGPAAAVVLALLAAREHAAEVKGRTRRALVAWRERAAAVVASAGRRGERQDAA